MPSMDWSSLLLGSEWVLSSSTITTGLPKGRYCDLASYDGRRITWALWDVESLRLRDETVSKLNNFIAEILVFLAPDNIEHPQH